ncbi:zinc finger MYM-type protein 1-like [Populus alba x Populus x berolinensis]|nr:zinc finger MYM-type protein 1-like [Populus alba x Populus x berolinensis]
MSLDKYFKRKSLEDEESIKASSHVTQSSSKKSHIEINPDTLLADPGLRRPIYEYHINDRDAIRRAYLQKGPCQPSHYDFPQKQFGNISTLRRFNPAWFGAYPTWLEYSIAKDAAFCLYCYLFKLKGGVDSFVGDGFSNWKKRERFDLHIGKSNSSHNAARIKCENLMNQGLPFRGHDECECSSNQGNYLELLHFLSRNNEAIKRVTFSEAPKHNKLTSPDIQKDITQAAAEEITNVIIKDLGESLFSILIDESRDISIKEQMAVVIRYVDNNGHIIERFLGIQHVSDTTASSLKAAIEALFSKHGLSISRLRGQGYDGASNMRGEFNGLLQLTLVAVTKKHNEVGDVFNFISSIINIVGASCKRMEVIREKQYARIIEGLENGEISSGRGLNQETSLRRYGDTRWGSHYITIIRLLAMFSSVLDVLEIIREDGMNSEQRTEAIVLTGIMESFNFVFMLHCLRRILAVTNELSQALQRKDQDIENAMSLLKTSKERFKLMRENDWESLLEEVSSFCIKHDIDILNMDDEYKLRGRSRRKSQGITNLHHFRYELFNNIIDIQLTELDDRFTETSMELLLCVACLSPNDSFSTFNKEKLIRLALFYPSEFSIVDLMVLGDQLDTYIIDLRGDDEFSGIEGIASLAEKMVKTKKNLIFPLVYMLIKLSLLLPVATATVERVFSAMHIVKSRLRNKMGDKWMNDSLVVYIEKDIFDKIDNEAIMKRFQNMKTRREQL